MYCSDFRWILLFIFINALLFLLYILFEKKVDRTVNFYYCNALPIKRTVLKKQACNIDKYWSYNRNLRVLTIFTKQKSKLKKSCLKVAYSLRQCSTTSSNMCDRLEIGQNMFKRFTISSMITRNKFISSNNVLQDKKYSHKVLNLALNI